MRSFITISVITASFSRRALSTQASAEFQCDNYSPNVAVRLCPLPHELYAKTLLGDITTLTHPTQGHAVLSFICSMLSTSSPEQISPPPSCAPGLLGCNPTACQHQIDGEGSITSGGYEWNPADI